jgi:SCY1-like protein 2
MLQAATAFFKTSQIYQNYAITTVSGQPSANGVPGASPVAPFSVGLWRIQEAVHKTNGKKVSIWSFDKRSGEMERLNQPSAKERVFEVLKAEVRRVMAISSRRAPHVPLHKGFSSRPVKAPKRPRFARILLQFEWLLT